MVHNTYTNMGFLHPGLSRRLAVQSELAPCVLAGLVVTLFHIFHQILHFSNEKGGCTKNILWRSKLGTSVRQPAAYKY